MSHSKKLRVGIAGYGVIGPRRRVYVDRHPLLQLVAVCDQKFTEDSIFEDGIKYYQSYKDLILENIDILFVCLTHDVAPEVTIAGLERGMHVFCEKPPGRTPADIKAVIAVEKTNPALKLKYGFNHRYHDSVIDAINIIRSKEMGEIINVRGLYGKSSIVGRDTSWRSVRALSGGGILLDQGIHMLDLMRLICGNFTEVKSFITNSHWEHDVEDNAYVLLRTDAGVMGMMHSTATQWRHKFQLDITLTRGALSLTGILTGSKSYGQETMTIIRSDGSESGVPSELTKTYIVDNSWKMEIDEFIDCITQNKIISSGSSADALDVMELVYKIYAADKNWSEKYNIK
jgi:predicted dehydrogenase